MPKANAYEIEIKSLLGDQKNADTLRSKLHTQFPDLQIVEESKQLNHYFIGGDFAVLAKKLKKHLSTTDQKRFTDMLEKGRNISVRTRQLNDEVILVMKASIDDTTSSNGISRMEFEAKVPITLDELDQILIESGLEYQAKWSRQREAYQTNNLTVSIDKNAGYGYLAEFEMVVEDPKDVEPTTTRLRQMMKDLAVEELAQDRLERMFAHYNKHWPEYYGTDKVFSIE